MFGTVGAWILAIAAAAVVALVAGGWERLSLWPRIKYILAWPWSALHRKQLAQIEELRKDVDALLSVLDHWVTPGAGDKQRQFAYMADVLQARGKRGISGADMHVARIVDDHGSWLD